MFIKNIQIRVNKLLICDHYPSTGVAKISKLSEAAPYILKCSMEEELTGWVRSWSVNRDGYNTTERVRNGNKAKITNPLAEPNTRLELQEYSWAGMFICLTKIQRTFRNYCVWECRVLSQLQEKILQNMFFSVFLFVCFLAADMVNTET